MKKFLSCLLLLSSLLHRPLFSNNLNDAPISSKTYIVGGGIIGSLETYYAYKDAQKNGKKICVTVYEKGDSFGSSNEGQLSTNTSYNIVPSLTIDEILAVVPRGSELIKKLGILFNQPGGIRVDDVNGVNESKPSLDFKEAVALYGSDPNHDDRTLSLLMLGKKSMNLWQEIYNDADDELKAILNESDFNPCREPKQLSNRVLHDGYRIDLLYDMANAFEHAQNMKDDYEKLGYSNCSILSPDEVLQIDPYLTDFCYAHSLLDSDGNRIWKNDCVALWRPGGCIDTRTFLPKFYAYLKKLLGQYHDADNQIQDCFQLVFSKEVIGIEVKNIADDQRLTGLKFADGTYQEDSEQEIETHYVFCPGEAVGTLQKLGFNEPTYAGFAGATLFFTIPLSKDQIEQYKNFSHCMEVHREGIILSWQARFKKNAIFIGVGGTKAFYANIRPNIEEEFAKDRNLVQINMMNTVLPEFISLALGYDTKDKEISKEEFALLEKNGLAIRWVGRRAVTYDGFPTLGSLYLNNRKVSNARCTTHLGSGGVSFGPGAVSISRCSEQNVEDPFVNKILNYGDSRRTAN